MVIADSAVPQKDYEFLVVIVRNRPEIS